MKLGILVNTDKNLAHILGITKAAINNGHEVIIFNPDPAIRQAGMASKPLSISSQGVENKKSFPLNPLTTLFLDYLRKRLFSHTCLSFMVQVEYLFAGFE